MHSVSNLPLCFPVTFWAPMTKPYSLLFIVMTWPAQTNCITKGRDTTIACRLNMMRRQARSGKHFQAFSTPSALILTHLNAQSFSCRASIAYNGGKYVGRFHTSKPSTSLCNCATLRAMTPAHWKLTAHLAITATAPLFALVAWFALRKPQALQQCYMFVAFCVLTALYRPLWNPDDIARCMIADSLLLPLQLCIAVELFCNAVSLIPMRERRLLFALLIAITVPPALTVTLGYYDSEDATALIYRTVRESIQIGLTVGCFAGCSLMWIEPPVITPFLRKHALLVTVYFAVHTVIGMFRPRAGREFYQLTTLSAVSATALLLCWLWLLRPVKPMTQPPDFIG